MINKQEYSISFALYVSKIQILQTCRNINSKMPNIVPLNLAKQFRKKLNTAFSGCEI